MTRKAARKMTKDEAKMKTLKLVIENIFVPGYEVQVTPSETSCPVEFRVIVQFVDAEGSKWELDQVFHETLRRLEKK